MNKPDRRERERSTVCRERERERIDWKEESVGNKCLHFEAKTESTESFARTNKYLQLKWEGVGGNEMKQDLEMKMERTLTDSLANTTRYKQVTGS